MVFVTHACFFFSQLIWSWLKFFPHFSAQNSFSICLTILFWLCLFGRRLSKVCVVYNCIYGICPLLYYLIKVEERIFAFWLSNWVECRTLSRECQIIFSSNMGAYVKRITTQSFFHYWLFFKLAEPANRLLFAFLIHKSNDNPNPSASRSTKNDFQDCWAIYNLAFAALIRFIKLTKAER